jgi:hypothetical protein
MNKNQALDSQNSSQQPTNSIPASEMPVHQQLKRASDEIDALRASLAQQGESLLRCSNRDFATGFQLGWQYRQLSDGILEIYMKILHRS